MILIPDKYSDIELTKDEKLFVSLIKNKFNDNTFMMLKVRPINIENNIILFEEGACFIQTLSISEPAGLLAMLPQFNGLCKSQISNIEAKLLTHRVFNDSKHNINIGINYIYFIPLIQRSQMDSQILKEEDKKFLEEHVLFKDDIIQIIKDIDKLKKFLVPVSLIPVLDDRVNTFIHMVAPEYTIPVYTNTNRQDEDVVPSIRREEEYHIEQGSLSVRTLRLEAEQINIVNSIKPGHQLMLACAGSGKSVLLIAKAFKVASNHEDKDILITCYNKNLNDMYNWRINVAGFRNRNVRCVTFHKLCMMLLNEVNVYYDINDFEMIFKLAQEKLRDGTIKTRYYGIFIDEVQVFKPEWYEFCYDLLYSKTEGDYFFIICGDKSQNVASNVKQGKACWQGNPRLPNYRGKSIRLEKNYRNSDKINAFINNFTERAKKYATKYNIALKDDIESILRGKSVRSGDNPEIIITDRMNEAQKVIESVFYLHDVKKVDFSDIAILFCNRKFKTKKYYIYNWVIDRLKDGYLDYSELSPPDMESRVSYGHREGISLCTVEGALGLDFKAVIMCGISPIGEYNKSKIGNNLGTNNEEIHQEFLKGINTIYTGCSRARDHLIIVLNEDGDKSLYSRMLIEAKL